MISFLSQTKILQLNMIKFLKIPGFLFKIPGFPRFFQNFLNSRLFFPKLSNSRFSQVKWQPWNFQVRRKKLLKLSRTITPFLASLVLSQTRHGVKLLVAVLARIRRLEVDLHVLRQVPAVVTLLPAFHAGQLRFVVILCVLFQLTLRPEVPFVRAYLALEPLLSSPPTWVRRPVVLQVVFSGELLPASGARVRFLSSVRSHVEGEDVLGPETLEAHFALMGFVVYVGVDVQTALSGKLLRALGTLEEFFFAFLSRSSVWKCIILALFSRKIFFLNLQI